MKELVLNKSGFNKLSRQHLTLSHDDFEDVHSSYTPGEWIQISNKINDAIYVGFINIAIQNKNKIVKVVGPHAFQFVQGFKDYTEEDWGWVYIDKYLDNAIRNRAILYSNESKRLVYGESDCLSGLIIDEFENCLIVQINSAGIDRFREKLHKKFSELYKNKKIIFLDNEKQRAEEGLPTYSKNVDFIESVEIVENNLKLKVSFNSLQKLGYYFDHRENRLKLENMIKRLNVNKEKGLDLFCYCGTWGIHLLRAGVKWVDFVDQGKMDENINQNVTMNNFEKKQFGFFQENVFQFLENKIKEKKLYNVIVCDPPAFAKTSNQKNSALVGYQKLYNSIFQILNKDSVLAACSCTSYVSLEELDEVVHLAALKQGKKIRVIDIGIQGLDHPISHLKSKSNYLKYLLYIVE